MLFSVIIINNTVHLSCSHKKTYACIKTVLVLCPCEQAQLEGGRHQYRPVVMALTDKDILLFDSVPWTRDAWATPLLTYPLLATR